MNKVEIGILSTEDWQTYKSLRLSSLMESPESFGSTYEDEAEYPDEVWKSRLDPSGRVERALPLVAEIDGTPSGLAWGLIHDPDSKTAHVYQMWVTPERRGKGLGRGLLKAIISWAQALQLNTLVLAVTTNNTAAISLYRSFGFVPVGNTEELRSGSPLLAQPMALELCANVE